MLSDPRNSSRFAVTWFKRRSSGALTYEGCVAQARGHGCVKARDKSLDDVDDVVVSPDGKSVYVVASESNSITRFRRRANGALIYKNCFANGGDHGCKKPRHNSLGATLESGVAVSPDGRSIYVASGGRRSGSITRFRRRSNGALRYRGCFENGGAHGCRRPTHDSLKGSSGVAVSPDGNSLYVASSAAVTGFRRAANGALTYEGCVAITDLKRAADGTLTSGGCFANQGALGCELPVHDSLGRVFGVAVSGDGPSVYAVALSPANAITLFSREISEP
jgi:DNA-binding beta-propeller fold protein YncE